MKIFLNKIKASFINSTNGLESFAVVTWGWGAFFYFLSFSVFDNLLVKINTKIFDRILAITLIIYFIWHIYVAIKCAPKKPKLTKEERGQLRIQKGGASKIFFKKLFLQESITEMNSRNILIALDIYFILSFYSFIR